MIPNTDQDEPRAPRKMRRTTAIALCVLVAGLSYLSQEVPRRLREKRMEPIFSQAEEARRKLQEEIVPLADPGRHEQITARNVRGTVLVFGRLSPAKQGLLAKTVERFRENCPDLVFHVFVSDTPTARMDQLVAQIHGDLKALSAKHEWLSTYGDKCLREGGAILFMPKSRRAVGDGPGPAAPPQIFIAYTSKRMGKRAEHSTDYEKSFRFPSLGLKLHANIVYRGEGGISWGNGSCSASS